MIKRNMLLASAMFCSVAAIADTDMSVYQGSDVSVRVVNANAKMKFAGNKFFFGEESFETTKVDSVVLKHYVSVNFDGDKVTVSNPFDNDSVDIKIDGTTVEINSNFVSREIKYKFSGKSTNGNVVFSSVYKSKFVLDNLDLTSDGINPPIYVLTKKNTEVHLVGSNSLKNSAKDTVGATMRGKGQFEFKGDGSLEITSVVGHGIQSSDYVEIKSGKIDINAASDGIHVNDYYLQSGGNVNISTKADGVDVGEGYAEISGGTLKVTSNANEARGIRCTSETPANTDIKLKGGKVEILLSGVGARGLKTDSNVNVDGSDVLVVMSGSSKVNGYDDYTYTCGVKADGSLNVDSGKMVIICKSEAYSSRCLQADFSINCKGGVTALRQDCDKKVDSNAKRPIAIKSDGRVDVVDASKLFIMAAEDANAFKIETLYLHGGLVDEDEYEDEIMPNPDFWSDYSSYLK